MGAALRRTSEPAYTIRSRLEDRSGLARELEALDPDGPVTFIHLAARVSVPLCEANPAGAHRVNVECARDAVADVLGWAHGLGVEARVVYVSTGHVYAPAAEPQRITEDGPLFPRSVYARTKLDGERAIQAVTADVGVPLIVARVFGLIGPGQPDGYVLPAMIQRVREERTALVPGLDNVRDYLDARDVCEDLLLLAGQRIPGGSLVVNVCSGIPVSVRDLLRAVARDIDPSQAARIATTAGSAPGRPDDIHWLVGDPGRFVTMTGMHPHRRPLALTVADAVRIARAAPGDSTSEPPGID